MAVDESAPLPQRRRVVVSCKLNNAKRVTVDDTLGVGHEYFDGTLRVVHRLTDVYAGTTFGCKFGRMPSCTRNNEASKKKFLHKEKRVLILLEGGNLPKCWYFFLLLVQRYSSFQNKRYDS